ncbi:hypothetical protein Ae406Ps2_1746c [Pseudonocardia sp. Ae406_Ps2]|nr:hypothetical protein Ae406Ps2_1746c [Pseudonocardia sp. Ae406_Ps2]OLM06471.1 hypothetical protein Ae331Ps2_4181 [Pseudonocardia sp. Ae331_Ps2]OLM13209.1 hypothetical protein Ae505Ps2_3337 [Pseudonocardia sp. Ae505_Ps2]OLM23316.1 hypothetical protein Ae706Ps2_1749c [Pseudonocardia sp. Ae706_Ps2]
MTPAAGPAPVTVPGPRSAVTDRRTRECQWNDCDRA